MDQLRHCRVQRTSDRAAFTLLEVMIAMAILAIGLLQVAAMQLQAMGAGRSGRHTSAADHIAQAQMEQLQRTRWTNLAVTAWTAGTVVNTNVQGPNGTLVEQAYTVSWRITDVVATMTRSVDVRVTWNEPNRPNRTLVVSSIRYNHEGL